MLSFPFRLTRCFLAFLLALPLLAGDAAERRAGDCQPPNTHVLRVPGDFLALLAAAGPGVAPVSAASYPTLPVDPLDAVILGRLQTLQSVTDWMDLQPILADWIGKANFLQKASLPSGGAAATAEPVAVAEGPDWLRDLGERLRLRPRERVGWVHLEDPLRSNSISRFHVLIFGEEPGSASSASGQSGRRWWIQDLGSLNGVYVNNVRVPAGSTVPLRPGDRVRFALLSKRAKAYLDRIRGAALLGQAPSFAELRPLEVRDLQMEYEFVAASHEESLAARETWLNRTLELAERGTAQPPAQAAPLPGPSEVPAVAAASALPASSQGGVPMDVVAEEAWEDVGADVLSPDLEKVGIAKPPAAPPRVLPKALTCGLCRELMVDPVVLGCGDSFCRDCIQAWLRAHGYGGCPLCHLPQPGPIAGSFILEQAIAAYEHQLDPAARAARDLQLARRRAQGQVPGPAGERQ
jgi:hypothetical protein